MNKTLEKAPSLSLALPVDPNFPQIGDRVQFLQKPRNGWHKWHTGKIIRNSGRELQIETDGGVFCCPRRDWKTSIRFLDRPDPDFNPNYHL